MGLPPLLMLHQGFNPRPRVEGDATKKRMQHMLLVSIRALAWRATISAVNALSQVMFQSAPSRGGRHIGIGMVGDNAMFQSAPSRGGRPTR